MFRILGGYLMRKKRNRVFYFDEIKGRKILRSDLITEAENFFTTRECCIFSKTQDMSENKIMIENYLGQKLATNLPAHGNNITKIQKDKFVYENTDGLLIENKGCCFMNFGDCVPIVFYADHIGMIVHAGWRGTSQKIVKCAVDKLQTEFHIKAANIKAVIGPAICAECYEVGREVYDCLYKTVSAHDEIFYTKNDKYHVDLKNINKQQLIESGVMEIDVCPYCTACGEKMFFSYRYENHTDLRHSAVLKLG